MDWSPRAHGFIQGRSSSDPGRSAARPSDESSPQTKRYLMRVLFWLSGSDSANSMGENETFWCFGVSNRSFRPSTLNEVIVSGTCDRVEERQSKGGWGREEKRSMRSCGWFDYHPLGINVDLLQFTYSVQPIVGSVIDIGLVPAWVHTVILRLRCQEFEDSIGNNRTNGNRGT